jgi:hypothetical protein
VKFSYLVIWSWNFVDWFLTCLTSSWLWYHSFIICFHCLAFIWSWHMICSLIWSCICIPWLPDLIPLLPLVQIAWNLICCSLNVFCLSLNFLGIYWAILVLVWLWSFCLLQCDSKVHSLTCFVHKIDLVHSFDVRPIGPYSGVIYLDSCWVSLAVLNFSSPLDPRLVLVVLFLMFECDFQVEEANALRRLMQVDWVWFICLLWTNLVYFVGCLAHLSWLCFA